MDSRWRTFTSSLRSAPPRTNSSLSLQLANIVDVWFVPLDAPATSGFAEFLTDEELDRAARFRSTQDQVRWAACRLALRTILANRVFCDTKHIGIVSGANGKPELEPGVYTPSPYFNLSHSGGAALVALTIHFPLGVDIEHEKPFADMSRVVDRVFSRNERADLAALNDADFVRGFFSAWTRKEALIKATGAGLSADLQTIEVTLLPDVAPRVLRMGDDDPDAWQLFDIDAGASYRAALAARTSAKIEIVEHRFDP